MNELDKVALEALAATITTIGSGRAVAHERLADQIVGDAVAPQVRLEQRVQVRRLRVDDHAQHAGGLLRGGRLGPQGRAEDRRLAYGPPCAPEVPDPAFDLRRGHAICAQNLPEKAARGKPGAQGAHKKMGRLW